MRNGLPLLPVAAALMVSTSIAVAQERIKPIQGIGPTGPLQVIHDGFKFTEGPAPDPQGRLYFTDVPNSSIYRVNPGGEAELLLADTKGANGLMFDQKGRLYACQGGKGAIISIDVGTKQVTVLADQFAGKRFNRPNDLVVDRHGGLYFTDPRLSAAGKGKDAFYYLSSAGAVTLLGDDLEFPNGIMLSPNETTLYVLPYRSDTVMAYKIKSPGKIDAGQVLCTLQPGPGGKRSGGDGMSIDTNGNLYVAVPAINSIQVISPAGTTLGLLRLPEKPSNCAFGGEDGTTLYITARQYVYALPMQATGHRFPGTQ